MSASALRNVLLIVSDDQGPWALGCAGNAEIQTPVLDSLAAEGVRLDRYFCASPVCSPARASMLTAHIPSRHGVHDYLDGAHAGQGSVDYLADVPTLTDVLADAGYRCGLSGKWHLGASDRPRSGFVHWFCLEAGGTPYNQAEFFRGEQRVSVDGYVTDVIADDAIAFLESDQEADSPFFLSVNFTAPHKPFAGQHPQRFTELYRDCAFETCPQGAPHPWQPIVDGAPIGGERDTREALIGYFAAVTAMDEAIGRILNRLDELGLANTTTVVFTSDNGFNAGHHGIWGKGNGTSPVNMFDESVLVPLIIRDKDLPSGTVQSQLVSAYSLAPTLLELAGLDHSALETGPGRSFAALLRGEVSESESAVVVHDEYGPVRMIRTDAWKYVHRYPHGPHELYDLVADSGETTNLVHVPDAAPHLRSLRRDMQRWFLEHADPAHDGAALPVSGGGQTAPLADDPLSAFEDVVLERR